MSCTNCQSVLALGQMMCTRCGYWQTAAGGFGAVDAAKTVTLDKIEATAIPRIVTGGVWDEAWGGGFVPSSTSLLAAPPGCGKTTVLLQIGARLAEIAKRRTYFFSAEQAPGEIKLVVDRLGLDAKLFRVLSGIGGSAEIDGGLLKDDPPAAFVVDSVSALFGKDPRAAVLCAKSYKKLSVTFSAPSFLIAHVSKSMDIAGAMGLQHETDVVMAFDGLDRRSELELHEQGYAESELDGARVLRVWKNRYGAADKSTYLAMSPRGLIALPPPKSERAKPVKTVDSGDEPRTRGRRPKAPDSIEHRGQILKLVPRRRPTDDGGDGKGPSVA